jgi:hypothetical protein
MLMEVIMLFFSTLRRRIIIFKEISTTFFESTRVYPKVSGLAAWSENCKWYSSLPLDAVVLLFCESV